MNKSKQNLIEKQEQESFELAVLRETAKLAIDTIVFDSVLKIRPTTISEIERKREVIEKLFRHQAEQNIWNRNT